MILYLHIFALSIQIKFLYRIFHINIFKKRIKKIYEKISRDYARIVSYATSLSLLHTKCIYNSTKVTTIYYLQNIYFF